jgi:uncharacterized membrane protein YgcG
MASRRLIASLVVAGAVFMASISLVVLALSGTTAAAPASKSSAAPASGDSIAWTGPRATPYAATLTPPDAGPPYPEPVTGQRVYDYAPIFSSDAIASAEATIRAIEDRTGAQIAVYTQIKPESNTLDEVNADALALMNQWGVGRKGFDDGLVILFDMEPNLRHGQVSLYAGSGYRAAFLSDADRQAIFDEEMLPRLKAGDLDGGLMAALRAVEANATPEHAAALEHGRQINALIFVGGLLLGALLVLLAFLYWLRHGRDPVYIDDSSILMPAPPAELTPAMATLVLADRTSDRTVTAGLVDLAARGCVAFEAHTKRHEDTKTGIRYLGEGKVTLPASEAALRDNIAKKTSSHKGRLTPSLMYRLIDGFNDFKDGLETAAVKRGWLTAKPSDVIFEWRLIAGLEIAASLVIGFFWLVAEVSGLSTVAVGLLVAGIATWILAGAMPCRTRQGAMLWAMLSAYRRTLKLTLAQARSMGDVVRAKALPWVTTPDQAMAWGVAFGLDREIEDVLRRSLAAPDEEGDSAASDAWLPAWWLAAPGRGSTARGFSGAGIAGRASGSAGLFSASAIPDPGSIMAALGSISHPSLPASSSSSGGGGFSSGGSFGGGGGGGGGGAGGGF